MLLTKIPRSLTYFLIIKVKRDVKGKHLNQTKYVRELFRKTGIHNYKECYTLISTIDKFIKDMDLSLVIKLSIEV